MSCHERRQRRKQRLQAPAFAAVRAPVDIQPWSWHCLAEVTLDRVPTHSPESNPVHVSRRKRLVDVCGQRTRIVASSHGLYPRTEILNALSEGVQGRRLR